MHPTLAKLPSPRALLIFDAAARLGSFTRAAEELHMQQPSVSAAIKQLEDILGAHLFTRGHRRVELTSAGERLFSDVSRALTDIESSLSSVQEMSKNLHVTLSSSSAFSYYWMMPKLGLLRECHPEIDLRMQISIREPDLDAENIQLAIRRGKGDWADCHAVKIADEAIYPVASPQVMAAARNLRTIPDLLNERLIHLEEPVRERPSWANWFSHHKVTARDLPGDLSGGLRLNDYALVLQAAVSGEGFAFGWDHVVRHLIEQRLLAARTDWVWRTGNGIYLVWSRTRPLPPHARRVKDWIISVSDFPASPDAVTA